MAEVDMLVPVKLNSNPEDRPKRSDTIGKICAALAKAQGEMENAEKDVKGNYGKYATLAATWDAIRSPLSKNEISVYQRILTIGGKPTMCTMLAHSSGEFLDDCELEMIFDRTGGRLTPMQAMGSAVTYARRYSLQSVTGVAPADDDDGAGAGKPMIEPSGPPPQRKNQPPVEAKKPPAKPKVNPNLAPVTQQIIDQLHGLCCDRQIAESIFNKLIIEGYGFPVNKMPVWVAKEVGALLEIEDTNEATLMAENERVIARREAKRIAEEGAKA